MFFKNIDTITTNLDLQKLKNWKKFHSLIYVVYIRNFSIFDIKFLRHVPLTFRQVRQLYFTYM